jgi:hypothetical protein
VLSALGPLPGLYVALGQQRTKSGSDGALSMATMSVLLSMTYHIVASYPSQVSYRAYIQSLPKGHVSSSLSATFGRPRKERLVFKDPGSVNPDPILWIQQVASSLRRRNWARFGRLTTAAIVGDIIRVAGSAPLDGLASSLRVMSLEGPVTSQRPISAANSHSLSSNISAGDALRHLVTRLHKKVRDTAWSAMRVAYREWACDAESETRMWLQKSLGLPDDKALDNWLRETEKSGGVKPKAGSEGRWIVYR